MQELRSLLLTPETEQRRMQILPQDLLGLLALQMGIDEEDAPLLLEDLLLRSRSDSGLPQAPSGPGAPGPVGPPGLGTPSRPQYPLGPPLAGGDVPAPPSPFQDDPRRLLLLLQQAHSRQITLGRRRGGFGSSRHATGLSQAPGL